MKNETSRHGGCRRGDRRLAQHASRTTGEWTAYGGDARNTKYSSLSDIDASNARDLQIAWRWSSPDNEIAKARPGFT